jgi:capsular polysaccharide biosynthesis protein/GGDEF domain-containing protein
VDPRAALSALRARWWVLVLTTALTVGLGVALTFLQPRAYVATSTYVVAPTEGFRSDVLSAISLISRQTEIAETFAQVAMSNSVAEAVHAELDLAADAPSVTIESQVRPGTTVLEVTARSSDPQLAESYANATGDVLPDYLEGVNAAVRLVPLDAANDAIPVPSGLILNVALGLVVGLALGAGLVLAVRWLRGLGRPQPPEIVDSESLAYNSAYFALRLRQEMSRVRRSDRPMVVALLRVVPTGAFDTLSSTARLDVLRIVTAAFDANTKVEDVAARIDDSTFAILLPDTSSDAARNVVDVLRGAIDDRLRPAEGGPDTIRLHCISALLEYNGRSRIGERELMRRAERQLARNETQRSVAPGVVPAGAERGG